MKSSTPKDDKGSVGLLGGLRNRRKKSQEANVDKARTFSDNVEDASRKLNELIITKQADLKNESGKEQENRQKLSMLESMAFHLDKTLDLIEDWNDTYTTKN